MDTTTYEQHTLDPEAAGDSGDWLQPEMHIQVEWLSGRPVGIELPSVVELTVVQTSPVMRGATKTASTKPAKQIGRSTRLNSSHMSISYAVFCLKKKKNKEDKTTK